MDPALWNPWHGCTKYSEGCMHCYVYRRDQSVGKDASLVTKTKAFDLPVQKDRWGLYKLKKDAGPIYTCMTSDFFLDKADPWRDDAWRMIHLRDDLQFVIITKRIVRFSSCLPKDWKDGYPNVTIICTVENQKQADLRLPVFLTAPIRRKAIICEPILEAINLEPYLDPAIEMVTVGGESGDECRVCDYAWVLSIRDQCIRCGIPFRFKQTGTLFRKEGKGYRIKRELQMSQAKKAGIDWNPAQQT